MTKTKALRTAAEPSSETGAKVLLIDDELAILSGVSDFLEGEGFSVVPASNGVHALKELRAGRVSTSSCST